MAPIPASPRILSIQSHVVSGYCGNKSATFPLQLMGLEVDVINTVQLSNHTQYKVASGQVYGSNDLEELFRGLAQNKLLHIYDNIISGYVADVGYIESMAGWIRETKLSRVAEENKCWYTLDPVLGDDGVGFYVPQGEEIAEAYRKFLIPQADIITPNRFEASILSGQDIDTSSTCGLSQAMSAMKKFHHMGVKVVVITSFELEKDQLTCIMSYRRNELIEFWIIKVPKIPCAFTGTGDLFTATLTGWLRKTNFNFVKSFENATNSVHEILENTFERYKEINDGSVHSYELRLIQNKESIEYPKDRFKAEKIDSSLSYR